MAAKVQKIDISSLGDNIIISGATGQSIRIVHLWLVCAGIVNVILKDGSTDLTGLMAFTTNGGMVVNTTIQYPIILSSGSGFLINLSGNVQVSGMVLYENT